MALQLLPPRGCSPPTPQLTWFRVLATAPGTFVQTLGLRERGREEQGGGWMDPETHDRQRHQLQGETGSGGEGGYEVSTSAPTPSSKRPQTACHRHTFSRLGNQSLVCLPVCPSVSCTVHLLARVPLCVCVSPAVSVCDTAWGGGSLCVTGICVAVHVGVTCGGECASRAQVRERGSRRSPRSRVCEPVRDCCVMLCCERLG